jgi:nicotinamidase-related amidase
MAITTLDAQTALIAVDLQKAVASARNAPAIEHGASLCQAFRRHGLPVVLVNVTGGAPGRKDQGRGGGGGERAADWAELLPALDAQPSDHRVTKRTWGAFTNTDLLDYLRGEGVTQVVLAGVATSIGVESTARQAHELGFNVTLATDAMSDGNADAHENSVTRIFPRLGETGTAADVIAILDARTA